jgi:hypothetical protein
MVSFSNSIDEGVCCVLLNAINKFDSSFDLMDNLSPCHKYLFFFLLDA